MFKKLNGEIIDLVSYIKNYIILHPDIKIFIGCDSQNYSNTTSYVTAIVLYNPGKGGHIVYEKEKINREKVNQVRLLNEVWKAVEVANMLCENGIRKPEYIDIDINPCNRFKSNTVFKAAVGIVEGCGYQCRYKSLGPISTWCADKIVRK